MHPPALAACSDDARAAKIGQMPGDFWLAHSQHAHEVAHTTFLVGDEVQKAKTRRIGEGAKEKIERERFFLHSSIIYGLTYMNKAK